MTVQSLSSSQWLLPLVGDTLPDRELVGGKGWSLARMVSLGLPVPPAFVVTTRACRSFLDSQDLPPGLHDEIAAGIAWLERETERRFDGGPRPLLLSIRSGAPVSMPGMMDTILNLGINSETERLLAVECRDPAFARDTHRRFVELYGEIVLKATPAPLRSSDDFPAWRDSVRDESGHGVPESVQLQLDGAVRAVFESWNSRRAQRYRRHHGVPDHYGTAVVVQAMVFGNLCERSGTGVLFTRNPANGEPEPYGEFLPCAQGEDVVSGRHTPMPLEAMKQRTPQAHSDLLAAARLLEQVNGDVQDIEFTVERGRLYLLQSRSAKRAPLAAVRIARDMVNEGVTSADEAFPKLTPDLLRAVLGARLPAGVVERAEVVAEGVPASPGVATGVVVTDADEAEQRAQAGANVVLARATTSPKDLNGMIAARAIVTEHGGSTSHAAVVGRSLGRPCVVGCGTDTLLPLAGRTVTVDGAAGRIYAGQLTVDLPDEDADPVLRPLLQWAEGRSPVQVLKSSAPGQRIADLDNLEDIQDPKNDARLHAYLGDLPPGCAVRGRALDSEVVVAACVRQGIRTLIACPRLPVLLAAVRAAPN